MRKGEQGATFLAKVAMSGRMAVEEDHRMTTMNISVPDEMKAFVEAQMAQEGYASVSEYLRALIRDAQKRRARQALEATFREALESGPATPMARDDWDQLERQVWERNQQAQAQQS
jgi:antitoxin ParD1/3/4